MKQISYYLLFFISIVLFTCEESASKNNFLDTLNSPTIFDHLQRKDTLHLHLKANLKELIFEKMEKEKNPAQLTFQNAKGAAETWDITIRPRGNMRNKICLIPPMKIDFNKTELQTAGLNANFDELKLVVQCNSGKAYNDFVLKEYLAYKIYNELTPYSFQVQLVYLSIEDIEGKIETIESYAFLIENEKQLAHRLQGTINDSIGVKEQTLHAKTYDQVCLFQYLIGNTDWHVYNQHNLKIMQIPDLAEPIVVPYDFDYAGMVAPPYATPPEKLVITDVKDRFYLGACRASTDLMPVLEHFLNKKTTILNTANSFPYWCQEDTKSSVTDYLTDFFAILENPEKCEELIIQHCDKQIKVGEG